MPDALDAVSLSDVYEKFTRPPLLTVIVPVNNGTVLVSMLNSRPAEFTFTGRESIESLSADEGSADADDALQNPFWSRPPLRTPRRFNRQELPKDAIQKQGQFG